MKINKTNVMLLLVCISLSIGHEIAIVAKFNKTLLSFDTLILISVLIMANLLYFTKSPPENG